MGKEALDRIAGGPGSVLQFFSQTTAGQAWDYIYRTHFYPVVSDRVVISLELTGI